MDWLDANKQWLFDGVLVAIPIAILGWYTAWHIAKSTKDPGQVQGSGPGTVNVQIAGDLVIQNEVGRASARGGWSSLRPRRAFAAGAAILAIAIGAALLPGRCASPLPPPPSPPPATPVPTTPAPTVSTCEAVVTNYEIPQYWRLSTDKTRFVGIWQREIVAAQPNYPHQLVLRDPIQVTTKGSPPRTWTFWVAYGPPHDGYLIRKADGYWTITC